MEKVILKDLQNRVVSGNEKPQVAIYVANVKGICIFPFHLPPAF